MNYMEIVGQVLMIVAVLTIFVNIITEVAKNAFSYLKGSRIINVFVLVLSLALTLTVFLAYWQIKQLEITWYIVTAFLIVGFLVAYSAMFGYDKLISIFKKDGGEK